MKDRLDMEQSEVYECWMCGMEHRNPVAYLWHIHACGLEKTGSSALLAKKEAILTATATKKL